METIMRRILGALALVLVTAPAGAQTMTGFGKVTLLRTGWNADSFAVVTAAPLANPAHCPTPDGYISLKPAAGYGTYYDAAKLAFQTNANAQVTVDNTACVAGRPKIFGINLQR